MKKIKDLSRSGFTIVELLIVIVVIGILAGLVFVQFNNVQGRARDSERKADIRLIESKLAEYYADEGNYPSTTEGVAALSDLPSDATSDPDGNAYGYVGLPSGCDNSTTDCTGYTVSSSNMEKETNPYERTQAAS